MAIVTFITGGERSGKSRFAQKLALNLTNSPIYLATARVWDDDFLNRIKQHQEERDERWTTLEEEKYISKLDLTTKVVVLDCITLWLTNFFTDNDFKLDPSLSESKNEWNAFIQNDFRVFVVSNEVGMSLHADTESGRKFIQLQGLMNQHIAQHAAEVYLMISGIPIKIK